MKLLVISPHPDDETLGAGGTILKWKDMGHQAYWLNVTNMKREYGFSQERIDQRKREIERVRKAYAFDGFWDMGLEPTGMDQYDMGFLVSECKKVLDEVRPEVLLLPYRYDVHSDHRVIYDAVYSCTKSFRAPYLKTVLSMEILSETDQAQCESGFVPNVFVDVSRFIGRKIEIMKIYESEIDAAPFPRNENAIRGMAAYRGAAAYYEYGEAFSMIRMRME